MKTITLAKKIWNYAYEKQHNLGVNDYQKATLCHYFGILTMWAAANAADYTKDEEWMKQITDMYERYPYDFEARDLYFQYNFDNYRVGGLGKPWLMIEGRNYFGEDHKALVREYAEKTLVAPMSSDGILMHPYSAPGEERIWIDIVYAVTPFMIYAGILCDEQKYIDFGVEQCFKLYDALMDHEVGLLHQARGFMGDNTTVTQDHWSRGNGWGIIGLAEIIDHLPKESAHYKEAVKRFIAHAEALLKYQDHRGLWRQSIAEPLAWEEESGTGIILYAFGVGIRNGILDKERFLPALYRGVEGLMKFCINEDCSIDRCSHGCLCPGLTPERKGTLEAYLVDVTHRRDEGHAFGPAIMALTEAYRNGIIDVPWK